MRSVGMALAVLAVVSLLAMFAATNLMAAPTTQSDTQAMTDVQMTAPAQTAMAQNKAEGSSAVALAARTRASPAPEVALVLTGEQNSNTMEGARVVMLMLQGKQAAAIELTMQGSEGTMAGLALT